MEEISLKPLDNGKPSEKDKDAEKCASDSENEVREDLVEDATTNETSTSCCKMIECFETKKPMTKLRTTKNLVVLSVAFLIYECAFAGTSNLQSTMNKEQEVGVMSLIAYNVSFLVSVMLVPSLLVKRFGSKLNIVAGIILASTYFGANFYPHFAIIIPSAIILGFAESLLWACNSSYVSKIGFLYSAYSKEPAEVVVANSFGIFMIFLNSAGIWSSLISYYVLKPEGDEEVHIISNETLLSCGANFCNVESFSNDTNPNLIPPSNAKRYLISGIFLSLSLFSALIIGLLLDPLEREKEENKYKSKRVLDLLLSTLRQNMMKQQICLIPLAIFSGMYGGFHTASYSEAYVACVWGIHSLGYLGIYSSAVGCITSSLAGQLVKCISRPLLVVVGCVAKGVILVYMLLWTPTENATAFFFTIAGINAIAGTIVGVLQNTVYGIFFKGNEEAAYSSFYFWNTIGFILIYVCKNFFCIPAMIYILLVGLLVSVTGYLIADPQSYCGKKFQHDAEKGS